MNEHSIFNEQPVTEDDIIELNDSLEDSESGEGHIGVLPSYQPAQDTNFTWGK